jgi:hypothetical protein
MYRPSQNKIMQLTRPLWINFRGVWYPSKNKFMRGLAPRVTTSEFEYLGEFVKVSGYESRVHLGSIRDKSKPEAVNLVLLSIYTNW